MNKNEHTNEHINEILNEILNANNPPINPFEQTGQIMQTIQTGQTVQTVQTVFANDMSTDDEKTDEQYDQENQLIDEMFPNAQFTIAVDFKKLEHKITDKKFIIVKSVYDCYCYNFCNKPPDYFYIHGENMTYRYVLEQLIKQGLSLDCNHQFVETICQIGDSNVFEIWTGS